MALMLNDKEKDRTSRSKRAEVATKVANTAAN